MKAAVVEPFGKPPKIHEGRRDPRCGPRDAVIKVEASGIRRPTAMSVVTRS